MELNLHSLSAHDGLLQASSRRPRLVFKSVLQKGVDAVNRQNQGLMSHVTWLI